MKHFLIFPYDRYIRRSLELASDRLNDSIEDVLSLSGWGWTGDEVFVKDTIICVKDDICKVSEKCDSIWITESYYAIDFEKFILPILQFAQKKQWNVYYGRKTLSEEKRIIMNYIEAEKLFFIEPIKEVKSDEIRLYDLNIPIIWVVDLLADCPARNVSFEIVNALEHKGCFVEYVSKYQDIGICNRIELLPNISKCSFDESIMMLNHYLKRIENKQIDMILVDIPGNLLEASRKLYGDYGTYAYIMSKVAPPDIVICNIPYMDRVMENVEDVQNAIYSIIGCRVDFFNFVPYYFYLLESENTKKFEYVSVSNEFIEKKVGELEDSISLNSPKMASKLAEKLIQKLECYL